MDGIFPLFVILVLIYGAYHGHKYDKAQELKRNPRSTHKKGDLR